MSGDPEDVQLNTGGTLATPHVWISELVFSDGTSVPVSQSDILVIVGPNNVGKSAALRAVNSKLKDSAAISPVIQSIAIGRSGSESDLTTWIEGWTFKEDVGPPSDPIFQSLGHRMHRNQALYDWMQNGKSLGQLAPWFCHFLSAEERLNIGKPPQNIPLVRAAPIHPIHFLQRDDSLESKLSAKFRKAFGVDLIVNRNAGNEVPLHVGDRPELAAGEDRVSVGYVSRLEQLPKLHEQGDGMRSFAGVLLATSVGHPSIVLIDEPEAFLHPPQARLLGSVLLQGRPMERQLFIATHSSDVLRGMLDSESTSVRVLRLTRQGNTNAVRILDNSRVKELWGDPLLRSSNILDGLFHEGVVVCEADGDCRFFGAVLDAIYSGGTEGIRRPDLMFVHCGGKACLALVVRALREVGVPVHAVADFDIFSEEQPLRDVVEALGLDWANIVAGWKIVRNAVNGKKPELNTNELKERINKILSGVVKSPIPPAIKDEIQSVLRRSSPWSIAKTVGRSYVPSGTAAQACEALLAALRAAGLHVVEAGELEGFVRTAGGHGPKWVNEVLKRDLASDPELESARQFVRQISSASSSGRI